MCQNGCHMGIGTQILVYFSTYLINNRQTKGLHDRHSSGVLQRGDGSHYCTEDWRFRSIYQIVTDRLARTTTATCDTEDRQYCGETHQGVISHQSREWDSMLLVNNVKQC
ncbi:hypothetical protein C8Q69DRAFT_471055 [Paecilomyces variotii]|uniref:Uncharacterized protein n=1 Tax=Byssochlamys spectabilis TaxID=264951 RepID=A0A443HS97_BYSSP|nr:hypothetical protein C8Q69DRAFT_471055 [Paecilomyces variotii]RWQ94674.1 hypothetical protein C8Q69DRAFT_471055 [Paecilomyces variotii]